MRKLRQVLVVEDDDFVAQSLVDALMDEGYVVRRCANGQEALQALASWVPDLIVLDLMMPVMDGWRFRSAQRHLPGPVAGVPVLVLTGARESRTQARELAVDAVLAKPFDLDDLLRTVDQLAVKGGPS